MSSLLIILTSLIVGTVFHETTGEPIASATIYYPSLKVGTTTDEQGSFAIKAEFDSPTTLVVSAVGYRTRRFRIEPHQMGGIEVAMKEKIDWLEEVRVLPSDDEVKRLLKAVKDHRLTNDRFLLSTTTPALRTTDLGVTHLLRKQLGDSAVLPLYQEQQAVELQGSAMRPVGKPQQQALILTSTDYQALLHPNSNIDFYQNTVSLLGKAFISPLAANSTLYYRYFLADSIHTKGGKHYLVHFRTKNDFDPTFNGELEIDSATFALCRVQATVPAIASVNYLSGLTIHQSLQPDHSLNDEQIEVALDFITQLKNSTKRFPTVLLSNTLSAQRPFSDSDLSVQRPFSDSVLSGEADLSAPASFQQSGLIRTATFFATIGTTGYIPLNPYISIGHIAHILQVNEHETVHIGLPLATGEGLMKNIRLEAAIGYGFRDRAWKGLGRVSFNLPTQRRHILAVSYHDMYQWTEINEMTHSLYENSVSGLGIDFTAYAFEALRTSSYTRNTAARQRQGQIRWEADWSDIVETTSYIKIGTQAYGNPLVGYYSMPYYTFATLGTKIRLGWEERRIDGFFRRIHRSGKYPTLVLGAELGSFSHPDAIADPIRYHLYGHLDILLKQTLSLGLGGTLDYAFLMGLTLGKNLPYPLLHSFAGNQGYAYDPYRFTLMNNLQFFADKYLQLHLNWNGQGILFNRIPGLRYLHWRELAEFKLAYGGDLAVPYVELGVGIGNIFRLGEIYSVWRLTHRNDPSAAQWALRFRIHLGL